MSDFLRALLLIMLIVSIGILGFWATTLPPQAGLLRDARVKYPNITAQDQRPAWTRLRIEQAIVWTLIAVCSLGAAVLVRGYFRPHPTAAPAQRKRPSVITIVAAAVVTLLFIVLCVPFVLQTRVSTSSGFKHIVNVRVVDKQGNQPLAGARVVTAFDPNSARPPSEWAITDGDGRCQVTAYFAGSTRTTRFSRSGVWSASGWLVVKADGFETYRCRLWEFFGEKIEWKGSPPNFSCTVALPREGP